ncbi:hypothetical protein ACFQX7_24420 [Luedemannella flava]
MPSTRSRDRELVATTSNLVEFLRDVAQARRRRVLDVAEHETVLWLADLPAEVILDRDAGAGEALFAVPRVRAEAPRRSRRNSTAGSTPPRSRTRRRPSRG